MDISGRTVFIPGATSGIGLGLARRFADAGSTVIIGGRRQHLIDEIAAGHERIEGVVIDTSDPHSISTVAHEVQTRWPRTDTLITMAGIMPSEDWLGDFLPAAEASITVNLLGPVRLMGAFLPFLLAQPRATIVNVASGLAFVPLADSPAYCAAKAAIHMLDQAIRVQLRDTAVEVLELTPPKVQTPLQDGLEDAPDAMPLDAFLDETMKNLQAQPDGWEILTERVKFLRYPERNGGLEQVTSIVNGLV